MLYNYKYKLHKVECFILKAFVLHHLTHYRYTHLYVEVTLEAKLYEVIEMHINIIIYNLQLQVLSCQLKLTAARLKKSNAK